MIAAAPSFQCFGGKHTECRAFHIFDAVQKALIVVDKNIFMLAKDQLSGRLITSVEKQCVRLMDIFQERQQLFRVARLDDQLDVHRQQTKSEKMDLVNAFEFP